MGVKVKDLPPSERPYEKCEAGGPQALSDAELLAVIFRSGINGVNSMDLAVSILNCCGPSHSISGLSEISREELLSIRGVGRVKAIQIECLMEFSKRLWRKRRPERRSFMLPSDCADYYMEEMRRLPYEEVRLMLLDNGCRLIDDVRLSSGTVNMSLVSSREVYVKAAKKGAVKLVLVHNHPSGNPKPSEEDLNITRKLIMAGSIMDIFLMDSIIIGDGTYVSIREEGLLEWP